jgi:hypothetical protein
MTRTVDVVSLGGLFATMVMCVYMVAQLDAQAPALSADLRSAATAQVRAQGQVVLEGQFAAVDEDDDDVERKAALAPITGATTGSGEAEVEFDRDAPTMQEVEFSVENLTPGTAVTFVVDGHEVATATTDNRGRAEIEVDVPLPGTTASR